MRITLYDLDETISFGEKLGKSLQGREVIELVGDVGAGKTTLVKGIAAGMGINAAVQSPTFTISRQYEARDGLRLVHYDFYRLSDAGIMRDELGEAIEDNSGVVVLEWAGLVDGVLPEDRLTIDIKTVTEVSREMTLSAGGEKSSKLLERLA